MHPFFYRANLDRYGHAFAFHHYKAVALPGRVRLGEEGLVTAGMGRVEMTRRGRRGYTRAGPV